MFLSDGHRDVQQTYRYDRVFNKSQAIELQGCRRDSLTEQALSAAALAPLHRGASPRNITANTTRETDTGTVENGTTGIADRRSRR
jgi:hypothetical protein